MKLSLLDINISNLESECRKSDQLKFFPQYLLKKKHN